MFKKKTFQIIALILILASLACGQSTRPFPDPTYTPRPPRLGSGQTAYGFFPTPPQISLESLYATYQALGEHGEVVLVQENIPWVEFAQGIDATSQKITDLKNNRPLAQAHNLESIYIVDPLNGLNRREFSGLPAGWEASFANPQVRSAYKNFALRILREFKPLYLGLASEINTYAEAYPEDFPYFLSLYRETYAAIKAESPKTQVFVTFQWEQVNGLTGANAGNVRRIEWEQIEVFEPNLDLWVISSYPFITFHSGAEIPADYYSLLAERTTKPLAVAEGGFSSRPINGAPGSPQDQVDYLNAVHSQIGPRLDFWIYLLLTDLDLNSYAPLIRKQGGQADVNTLGFFVAVGLREKNGNPKPALQIWDSFRTR